MNRWGLFILVMFVWVVWIFGGLVGLWADKLEGKRPSDAGFSILPVFPLFPLMLLFIAELLDGFVPPWGSYLVGGFHILLTMIYLVVILLDVRRGWRAK